MQDLEANRLPRASSLDKDIERRQRRVSSSMQCALKSDFSQSRHNRELGLLSQEGGPELSLHAPVAPPQRPAADPIQDIFSCPAPMPPAVAAPDRAIQQSRRVSVITAAAAAGPPSSRGGRKSASGQKRAAPEDELAAEAAECIEHREPPEQLAGLGVELAVDPHQLAALEERVLAAPANLATLLLRDRDIGAQHVTTGVGLSTSQQQCLKRLQQMARRARVAPQVRP